MIKTTAGVPVEQCVDLDPFAVAWVDPEVEDVEGCQSCPVLGFALP